MYHGIIEIMKSIFIYFTSKYIQIITSDSLKHFRKTGLGTARNEIYLKERKAYHCPYQCRNRYIEVTKVQKYPRKYIIFL